MKTPKKPTRRDLLKAQKDYALMSTLEEIQEDLQAMFYKHFFDKRTTATKLRRITRSYILYRTVVNRIKQAK